MTRWYMTKGQIKHRHARLRESKAKANLYLYLLDCNIRPLLLLRQKINEERQSHTTDLALLLSKYIMNSRTINITATFHLPHPFLHDITDFICPQTYIHMNIKTCIVRETVVNHPQHHAPQTNFLPPSLVTAIFLNYNIIPTSPTRLTRLPPTLHALHQMIPIPRRRLHLLTRLKIPSRKRFLRQVQLRFRINHRDETSTTTTTSVGCDLPVFINPRQ